MIGVELVRHRATREPNPDFTKRMHKELRERGVLVSTTGVEGCVLRITPALVLTAEEIEHALVVLDQALTAVAKQ
jgi:4-aminobutyrate aminotransferase-like enzyme